MTAPASSARSEGAHGRTPLAAARAHRRARSLLSAARRVLEASRTSIASLSARRDSRSPRALRCLLVPPGPQDRRLGSAALSPLPVARDAGHAVWTRSTWKPAARGDRGREPPGEVEFLRDVRADRGADGRADPGPLRHIPEPPAPPRAHWNRDLSRAGSSSQDGGPRGDGPSRLAGRDYFRAFGNGRRRLRHPADFPGGPREPGGISR